MDEGPGNPTTIYFVESGFDKKAAHQNKNGPRLTEFKPVRKYNFRITLLG